EASASRASCTKVHSAARNSRTAAIEPTWAAWFIASVPVPPGNVAQLPLPQIFLGSLGLAQQERNMEPRGLEKAVRGDQRLLEFLDKLLVFLVAPALAQASQLPAQHQHLILQFVGKSIELVRKAAQLLRIDNRLRHADAPLGC